MKAVNYLAIMVVAVTVGCSGGSDQSAELVPAPVQAAPAVDLAQQAAPEVAATPTPSAPPEKPAEVKLQENDILGGNGRPLTAEELQILNYGLGMFKEEKGRFPATLEEAVATRHILRLPKLPAGEKFVYDSQTGNVKVETTN